MESSVAVTSSDRRTDLGQDQPVVPPAYDVVGGAVAALARGETHYVEVGGIAPMIQRLTEMVGQALPGILVTAGVQESRFLAIQIVGEQRGGVALPAVVDPGVVRAANVRALPVTRLPAPREDNFLPTPAAIRAALEAGAKLLYLESPSRLTGVVYDEAAVAEIAGSLVELDGTVIWDQGLAPWVHASTYASISHQPGMGDRAIVIGEAWPGMGLENWYVGYLAASAETVNALRTYKQIISICTSTAAQYGALAAASVYAEQHPRQVETLSEVRESGLEQARLHGLDLIEGAAANLLTLAVSDVSRAIEALASAGIAVADGAAFGAPGLIRLATTTDDTMSDAIECLVRSQTSGRPAGS
jgi:aspartate/methionine/tyrosine aminotransferase